MVRKFNTYVSFDQLVGATYAKSSKGKFGMYVEHHEKLNWLSSSTIQSFFQLEFVFKFFIFKKPIKIVNIFEYRVHYN